MSARHLLSLGLVASALSLCTLGGCRDFPVRALDAGAEPSPCAALEGSFAECDNASSTYCETDLATDPHHCGGCLENCNHLCFDGECLTSEPLLKGVSFPELEDSMIASERHLYARGEGAEGDGLYRISRETFEVEPLLLGLPTTSDFGLGVDRIYVRIGDAIHSVPLAGGSKLEVEVEEGVDLFAMHDGSPYWTRDGLLHNKTSLGGKVNTLGAVPEGVDMLVGGRKLLAAVDAGEDAFRLFAWDGWLGTFTELASGAGLVTRARVHESMAYVLVDDGASSVRGYAADQSAPPVRFDSAHNVIDFEVTTAFAYLAWSGDTFGGVDVIPVENPAYVIALGMDVFAIDMAIVGDDFYYLKYFPRHIFHLDVDKLR